MFDPPHTRKCLGKMARYIKVGVGDSKEEHLTTGIISIIS